MKTNYLFGTCLILLFSAIIGFAQSPVTVFARRAPKQPPATKTETAPTETAPTEATSTASETLIPTKTAVTEDGRTVILNGDGTWHFADKAQPKSDDKPAAKSAANSEKEEYIRTTLKVVETDQTNFIEVPIVIFGTLEVSSYYNYGYQGAETTHYSFSLHDNSGTGHVYMKRGELSAELRKRVLAGDGKAEGLFFIKILKSRHYNSSSFLAELISFKF